MAMTEEEEAKLKAELAQSKQQLTDLLAKSQTDENAAKEKETKRSKDKAGKVDIDPDVVKRVAELEARIEKAEKKLGSSSPASAGFFNLFE